MSANPRQKEWVTERLQALARAFPWPGEKPVVTIPREHLGWMEEGVQGLLAEALSADTTLVVELGAWLGRSSRFLADRAPNAVVVAIDHWLGSPEHRRHPEWRVLLPALYETFLALCWSYRDRIIPLKRTTLAGLQVLAYYGLSPDLIYVDAEHSYEAVLSELELSQRLFPQAVLVGHDYEHTPVREGVEEFACRHDLAVQTAGNGWRLVER